MSKTLFLIVGLLACAFAASPFDQVKAVVQNDACGVQGMQNIEPRLASKIEELRMVNNFSNIEPRQPGRSSRNFGSR